MVSQALLNCASNKLVTYARSLAIAQKKPASCFEFVSYVIAKSTPHAYQELLVAHKDILKNLPRPHRTPFFIPYYYSLLPFHSLSYWSKVNIADAQSGDLLLYIDKNYNPDPSSRAANTPSGTHIGIISDVLNHDIAACTRFSILDSSRRMRGRCFYHHNELIPPSKPGRIAYSFLNVLHDPATDLWSVKFDGQRPLENKHVYALRIRSKDADIPTLPEG
jgi:hypothetical protein